MVLSHAGQFGLIPSIGNQLMPASHHAVIIFFVISGFSVAYAADKSNGDATAFFASRFSRILSIAAPAILVTLVIDLVSAKLHPHAEDIWQLKHWFAYLIFAFSFSGELWFTSIHPFSNIPFWSLNYEVYYYVLFAAILIRSRGIRVLSVIVIVCAIGPKIILLLPCWLCGVGLYQWLKLKAADSQIQRSTNLLRETVPWAVFAFLYIGLIQIGFAEWANSMTKPYHSLLRYSKDFLFDTVLAIGFSGCLYLRWKLHIAKPETNSILSQSIRWLAPLTFAIYAMHYPMLKFIAEASNKSAPLVVNVFMIALVFFICVALGWAAGPTRRVWQRLILSILEKAKN